MTSEDLQKLHRWEEFGGAWEVVQRTADEVTLSLLRCDAGEEVSRLTSNDPALLAHVDERQA